MLQLDYNRAEEYISLRSEMQQLSAFARQILYWTVVVIIVALGWYFTKPVGERISTPVFALFLDFLIWISYDLYVVYVSQVYRIGGYIGVFWESRDTDRRLQWHRFNRRGPPGGFFRDSVLLVYSGTSVLVALFTIYATIAEQPQRVTAMISAAIVLIGLYMAIRFAGGRRTLTDRRNRYEREWRRIRASRAFMDEIHDEYEMIPAEETVALRGTSRRLRGAMFALIAASAIAAAAFLSYQFATGTWKLSLPSQQTTSAIDVRFGQFDEMLKRLEERPITSPAQITAAIVDRMEKLEQRLEQVEQAQQKILRQLSKPSTKRRTR